METDLNSPSTAAPLDRADTRRAFATATASVKIYGALGALSLLTVAGLAAGGHPVNTFMWVRAVLLPLVAVLVHRLTVSASRGSQRAFERVRGLAVVLPVAIIGVDLIPGVCPPWYAAMQAVCMLPVIRLAFLTRGTALRTAFSR
ncbi:hypothetical protein [Streptomyces vietnamensis]|uniref:hypothetical protein n=1 Tax=Streptomyces vietnamensis TaxID=362257 RepID=UPI0006968651|nr:hypothetical protein [Streptomyces vietnamensis]